MIAGAFTTVSVLPNASTPMTVRVSERTEPFVTISIGDTGHGVTIHAGDEATLNALASALGEARAKLVGAITRAKRSKQSELPELAAS